MIPELLLGLVMEPMIAGLGSGPFCLFAFRDLALASHGHVEPDCWP